MLLGRQASVLSERVFKEFFARVSTAIQGFSDTFAGELLSKDLVDWEVVNDLSGTPALTPTQKSQRVLCAVQNKIAYICKK